jgi:[ribosomal protein S5]-alanine N-acetyltransferase
MATRLVEPAVRIETPRLVLACLPPSAALRLLDYYIDNRAHLERWEPARPPGFYSLEYWEYRLAQNAEDYEHDRALKLQVLRRDDEQGPVVGQVNFNEFVRGALHQCFLGYSVDHRHQGQGLMREALEHAIPHVFERLRLHRISANYQPHNERSAALLERLGFAVEGRARDYLYIDGAWRDHVLTARVNPSLGRPGLR